ncbi:chalcone isomerase family protein [Shewanella gelidimarina]|uniref:chalcone isomerase family protein n=1 Tax=Shewanella gelidimarina TaxID=56813 RepID=UPI00200D8FE0|nr:chalcone isomerase family protein [Shewanella gelidimarina]MCL1058611.1 chalcone isomerase family protein [Shewanella gelidimarina]
MGYSVVNRAILFTAFMFSAACLAQEGSVEELTHTIPPNPTPDLPSTVDAKVEQSFADSVASFQEVGRGEMQWWWFTLYRARLLTPDGAYSQGQYPLVLDIEYYQDIPSSRLLEATLDQWQHLGLDDSRQLQWQTTLSELWPDVTEGDKLSLKVMSPQVSQFYFNGKPLSKAMPAGFSDDFLSIWLSDQTSRPSLRKQLLGEVACDC